jgi:hypothetical protein
MVQVMRISILAVLFLTGSTPSYCDELKSNEAIVLIKFQNLNHTIDSSQARLTFASLDSDKSIKVRLKNKLQMFVVSAGSYYLKSVETGFVNMIVIDRPKPKGKNGALEIPAGSVVYLGDHGFDKKFEFHIRFLQESLLEAANMDLPGGLPIFVSREGTPPHKLTLK